MLNDPVNKVDPLGLAYSPQGEHGIPYPSGLAWFGNEPGDITTIGGSFAFGLGAGFSFDRVVMPNGDIEWFLTVGGGFGTPYGSLAFDRGKIGKIDSCDNINYDDPDFTIRDITGASDSLNLDFFIYNWCRNSKTCKCWRLCYNKRWWENSYARWDLFF